MFLSKLPKMTKNSQRRPGTIAAAASMNDQWRRFNDVLVDIQTDRVSLCLSTAVLRARAQGLCRGKGWGD